MPLVVLSAASGRLVGGVDVPLLFDVDVTVKFLFALPLMIAAEPIVHGRVRETVQELLDRGIVSPRDEPRFEAMVASAMRLRNSTIVEVTLLVLAFTAGYSIWRSTGAILSVPTWYSSPRGGFTAAGFWYALVSQPLARFILFRWYFRLLIWYVFSWKVSRLKLSLDALHPDRAGGVGFLEHTVITFSPVLIAQSSFAAGVIGNHIWHGGAKLPDFKFQIIGLILFLTMQSLVPLTFFASQLVKAKLKLTYELGRLATLYANDFGRKWLPGGEPRDEGLLGTGDIQSLADLANSYQVLRSMRPVPFAARLPVRLAILIAVPMMPLALTMVPLDELLRGVLKLVM